MKLLTGDALKRAAKSIVTGYDEANVGQCSIDLTVERVVPTSIDSVNQIYFKEEVYMPQNYLGYLTPRQSTIRRGKIMLPFYIWPGHQTKLCMTCFTPPYDINGAMSPDWIMDTINQAQNGTEGAQLILFELGGDEVPVEPYHGQYQFEGVEAAPELAAIAAEVV